MLVVVVMENVGSVVILGLFVLCICNMFDSSGKFGSNVLFEVQVVMLINCGELYLVYDFVWLQVVGWFFNSGSIEVKCVFNVDVIVIENQGCFIGEVVFNVSVVFINVGIIGSRGDVDIKVVSFDNCGMFSVV